MTDLAALVSELGLPATVDAEQPWMQALRLVLPRVTALRLHRQVPGSHGMKRGGVMHGAPVGAADLSGWVRGRGLHVEVECKYGDGKLRPEQRRWLDIAAEEGCLALVLTYSPAHSLLVNLHVAVEAVHAALRAREGGA